MNMDKTNIMSDHHVAPIPVRVANDTLKIVEKYVYLGQIVQLGKSNFEKEVNRRIQLRWAAFGIITKYILVQNSTVPKDKSQSSVCVTSDDLWYRDKVTYYWPHSQAQSCSAGYGESYAEKLFT